MKLSKKAGSYENWQNSLDLKSLRIPNLHYKFPQQHAKVLIMLARWLYFSWPAHTLLRDRFGKNTEPSPPGSGLLCISKNKLETCHQTKHGPVSAAANDGASDPEPNEWMAAILHFGDTR